MSAWIIRNYGSHQCCINIRSINATDLRHLPTTSTSNIIVQRMSSAIKHHQQEQQHYQSLFHYRTQPEFINPQPDIARHRYPSGYRLRSLKNCINESILAEKEGRSTEGIHHTLNNFHQGHFINGIPTQAGSSPSRRCPPNYDA